MKKRRRKGVGGKGGRPKWKRIVLVNQFADQTNHNNKLVLPTQPGPVYQKVYPRL